MTVPPNNRNEITFGGAVMRKKIAVEHSLTDVVDYLKEKGFDVESLDNSRDLNRFDAIVVTGQDSNILGIEDTETKTPVIKARGQSAELVYDQILRRT